MSQSPAPQRPRFLMDLGSPYAYLAAERIDDVVGEADWQVVLLGGIFRATGRESWANGPRGEDGRAEIKRRALQRGLPSMRWPEPWPSDGLLAARVATWADLQSEGASPTALGQAGGVGRAFITHALRLHFAEGRTLSDPGNVAEAATRAGLDPAAALQGATDPAVKAELRARTDAAVAAGVYGVPAVVIDPFVFWGDDQLEQAAILVRHTATPDNPATPTPSAASTTTTEMPA